MKPAISIFINSSPKNIQAINAVTTGIKKNNDTVLLAELFFIRNIKIENAPNETRNTWWLIANKKSEFKFINGSLNIKIIINKWNKTAPTAWYILFTDKGILLLIFFCQIVDVVIAIKATSEEITPSMG